MTGHPEGTALSRLWDDSQEVLTPSSDPRVALMDMLMMVLTSGRERTDAEFRSLLEEAGFSTVQVIRAASVSIIASRPV
jgi:hypothetical protein